MRWAADQTTKPGSRGTRLLSSSKSSRADYHYNKQQQEADYQRQTTKACKGPWPVRRPSRAHQAGRLRYKQGSRTIPISYLSPVKQQQVRVKFEVNLTSTQIRPFTIASEASAPWGWGAIMYASKSSSNDEGVLIPYTFPLYYNIIYA